MLELLCGLFVGGMQLVVMGALAMCLIPMATSVIVVGRVVLVNYSLYPFIIMFMGLGFYVFFSLIKSYLTQ